MVNLRPITSENYLEAFRLSLAPGQKRFVSDPVRSLAQAYVWRNQCQPFGIYAGETMVGYLLVIYDDEENTYNIWHLMVDQSRQRKGYGRAALRAAAEYIRTKPFGDSRTVLLTCSPENPAFSLYEELGYCPTGRVDGDEIELALTL